MLTAGTEPTTTWFRGCRVNLEAHCLSRCREILLVLQSVRLALLQTVAIVILLTYTRLSIRRSLRLTPASSSAASAPSRPLTSTRTSITSEFIFSRVRTTTMTSSTRLRRCRNFSFTPSLAMSPVP